MEKKCNLCEIIKPIENFKPTSNGWGKFSRGSTCVECQKIKDKNYREINKTIIKKNRYEF